MILTHNDRQIKLIPRKYEDIENITDYLEDFEHKRLTEVERATLEKQMFPHHASKLLKKLIADKKLDPSSVKDAIPVSTIKVLTSDNQIYYVIYMSNKVSVCCDESLYLMSPEKEEIDYLNPVSRELAPPPLQQLRMF